MSPSATIAATRLGMGFVSHVASVLLLAGIFICYLGLTLYNMAAPLLSENRVVPERRLRAYGL